MTNKKALELWKKISACIADEIKSNEEFAQKISVIIGVTEAAPAPKRSNRRNPAKIDPFALLEQGLDILADALTTLNVEELKDVIAANGMDPAKLTSRWKKHERLASHILEATQRKASQGEGFWNAKGNPSGNNQ